MKAFLKNLILLTCSLAIIFSLASLNAVYADEDDEESNDSSSYEEDENSNEAEDDAEEETEDDSKKSTQNSTSNNTVVSSSKDSPFDITYSGSAASVTSMDNYESANLHLNNILTIILIAVGIVIILLAIAILIKMSA